MRLYVHAVSAETSMLEVDVVIAAITLGGTRIDGRYLYLEAVFSERLLFDDGDKTA